MLDIRVLCSVTKNIVHHTDQKWFYDPGSFKALVSAVKLDLGREASLFPLVMKCTIYHLIKIIRLNLVKCHGNFVWAIQVYSSRGMFCSKSSWLPVPPHTQVSGSISGGSSTWKVHKRPPNTRQLYYFKY